jgi:cell wall-associated NlpC family hydrolase
VIKGAHVITADQLIVAARALKDVPWRNQGRTADGVDCGGFVVLALRNAGHDIAKYVGERLPHQYHRRATPKIYEFAARHGERISNPCPGCVVLFKFDGDKQPRHFGIVTYDGNVIHADTIRCRVLEHGLRAQWARWAHSYWKIPGVQYA